MPIRMRCPSRRLRAVAACSAPSARPARRAGFRAVDRARARPRDASRASTSGDRSSSLRDARSRRRWRRATRSPRCSREAAHDGRVGAVRLVRKVAARPARRRGPVGGKHGVVLSSEFKSEILDVRRRARARGRRDRRVDASAGGGGERRRGRWERVEGKRAAGGDERVVPGRTKHIRAPSAEDAVGGRRDDLRVRSGGRRGMRERLFESIGAERVRSGALSVRERVWEPADESGGEQGDDGATDGEEGTRVVRRGEGRRGGVRVGVLRGGFARGGVQGAEAAVSRRGKESLLLHDAVEQRDDRRDDSRQRGAVFKSLVRAELRDAKVDGSRGAVHRDIRHARHRGGGGADDRLQV